VSTIPLSAQQESASITGQVTDSSGAAVPGARVTIRNQASGALFNSVSDADGFYRAPQLRPGVYTISVTASGFSTAVREGIEARVNDRLRVDMPMQVGTVSENVVVTGAPPLLESQSSVLGSVIAENQVRDLPLNGRNFVQLAILSPGVTGTGYGARGTIMSGTRPDDQRPGTELFVNGNRESSNNYLYDGIDNNDRLTLAIVIRPNVEAIKEFKIQTNLYSAESRSRASDGR